MRTAVLYFSNEGFTLYDEHLQEICEQLYCTGFDVVATMALPCNPMEVAAAVEYVKNIVSCCFVCGDNSAFLQYAKEQVGFDASKAVVIDGVTFVVYNQADQKELDYAISLMGFKNVWQTAVFKTFGLTKAAISTLLQDFMKNKNRINIAVFGEDLDCATVLRYSGKMAKMAVDEILLGIAERLSGYIYAQVKQLSDATVFSRAAKVLHESGKTVAVAESFTGGTLAQELVKIQGASTFFKEGLVCYTDFAKSMRGLVDDSVLQNCGAVSSEAAYEMATALLASTQADFTIATTGYAGPDAPEGKLGQAFIAVGDRKTIHLYNYSLKGNRQQNMLCGAKAAAFHLIQLIKKPD